MIKNRLRNIKGKRKNVHTTGWHDVFIFIRKVTHAKIFGETCWVMKIMEKWLREFREFIQDGVQMADDLWYWTTCYQTVWLCDCISHKLFTHTEFYMGLVYKATRTIVFYCDQRLRVQTVIHDNNFTVISQNLLKKFAMGNFPLPQIVLVPHL